MPDLADLFPGFDSKWANTSIGRIFTRVGGKGPPLMLLHGYAQTNVMWHRVAPELAKHFTLVIPDLPGYGRFRLAGHDRGGRVAYRLALDHPGRLEKLAVLDIVPTYAMWHDMNAR